MLNQAILADFKDFEDAVQYFSAVRSASACIVSRNPGHFPVDGKCPALTPAEFLAANAF